MSHDSRSPQSPPLSPRSRSPSPLVIPPPVIFPPVMPPPSPHQLYDYPYSHGRRSAAKVRFSGWNSIHSPLSPTYSPLDATTNWAAEHISDTSSPPIPIVTPRFEHILMDQDYPFPPPEEPYRPPYRSATKVHHPPSHRPAHSLPGFEPTPSVRPSFHQAEGSSFQKHSAYPTPPYQNHRVSLQSTPYQGNSIYQLPTPPYPKHPVHQLPTPPYPSQSIYQQASPPYQSHSGYQQATPPYQNYSTYQQPTPQQPESDLIYQQPTTPYQNYSVHRQPTNSLLLAPGKELTAQGSNHLRPLLPVNNSPGMSLNETPNLFTETTISNKFMEKLLQHTIIGAEFDSSDRYPPPRCHPTTRLAIIERCKVFIVGCGGKEKLHWVVGATGVGKSAVMQTVAEETPAGVTLGASVFFAADKRQDGMKMFTTIAYQLAAKSEPYRQFIRDEITRDPSLLRKSLPSQFNQFIITPFIRRSLFSSSSRFLIIIDGLDQCDDPLTQRDLLGLISYFCMTYPASPIVWIISSRPEPHITSFFDDARFAPAYTKEELVVDSDEAREDVERYLHAEMRSIQLAYPSLKRKGLWPPGLQFYKIVTAAGGLFAYASTVVRYIGDPCYRGPGSRIRKVLAAIDADPEDDILENDYPLAQLDDLYDSILSKVPDDVLVDTKKLLLLYLGRSTGSFRLQCNLLGLTEDAAYTAMGHIRSLVRVPEPINADDEPLQFFHKSFEAYLRNFKRSGFFHNVEADAQQLLARCSMWVVEEVSGGVANGEDMKYDGVSLSWPSDDLFETSDGELRLKLYQHAIASISPATISTTILSRVPDDDMINARKLLLLRLYSDRGSDPFRMQCNLLGLTEDAAYGAIRNVSSIVRVPEPGEADDEPLKLFHKSFEDHLSDFERPGPGFSDDVRVEVEEFVAQTLLRVVEEVSVDSDEMAGDEVVNIENFGYLRGCPGVCDQVSLSWPGGDRFKMTDHELRLWLYSNAIANISCSFKADMKSFVNMACFRVLTTRFTVLGIDFPYFQIRDFVFDKHRHELEECGILKQVPLQALDLAAICGPIGLQHDRHPDSESSGSWNTSCAHEKKERFMGWSTSFGRYEEDDWSEDDDAPSSKKYEVGNELDATELPRFKFPAGNEFHWSFLGEECLWAEKQCNHCLQRLGRYFMDNPVQLATIFVDSTELCYGELSFVDPEDGGSLWTYRFFHSGSPKM